MAPCPPLTCTPSDERRQPEMVAQGSAQSVGGEQFQVVGLHGVLKACWGFKGEGPGTEDPRFKSYRASLLWKADLQIQGHVGRGICRMKGKMLL